jgi:hypothetical protein
MAGDEHMHEILLLGELGELLGGDVGATVRNQELQFGRQQGTERGDDLLGGELGASDKARQTQALAGAVIGQDQDGDPRWLGCRGRQG